MDAFHIHAPMANFLEQVAPNNETNFFHKGVKWSVSSNVCETSASASSHVANWTICSRQDTDPIENIRMSARELVASGLESLDRNCAHQRLSKIPMYFVHTCRR